MPPPGISAPRVSGGVVAGPWWHRACLYSGTDSAGPAGYTGGIHPGNAAGETLFFKASGDGLATSDGSGFNGTDGQPMQR